MASQVRLAQVAPDGTEGSAQVLGPNEHSSGLRSVVWDRLVLLRAALLIDGIVRHTHAL
eukprot:CAMPEP_0119417492 /NCGR_PEP_ID=MMETSP1335-20130426/15937_1 /TAXON_ID=259385 /ORGANISM="Chrysoculter rhomboideus, Strain RCC1486" /LENGTH=58 /DNA_ID=CAMNT_0007442673 /DNA_START=1035 /DNA_END=1208 /DNA_ORIENTATION=+